MKKVTLANYIKVKSRFQRSIQLIRDWNEQSGVCEYLLSPTARDISKQILRGVIEADGLRAWSITGPYGTGKSAFALFLTDLLSNVHQKHNDAATIRADEGFDLRPFIPVLLVGQRGNLIPDLLASLEFSFRPIAFEFADKVQSFLENELWDDRKVVNLYEEASTIANQKGFGGILIIIDEFGKYLEYIADNSEELDIMIMQNLAESVSRSNIPMVLITILHSSFSEYTSGIDDSRKSEWQKVQGRYADLSFLEPPEQFLNLVGNALENTFSIATQKEYDAHILEYIKQPSFIEARNRMPLESLLPNCIPLNPITAMLLWPLFRSTLSQNERSLFSFLNDFGPFGFQQFLQNQFNQDIVSEYTVNLLYDYITFTLGDSLLIGTYSRRWGEINNALNRLSINAIYIAREVIKVIGLLGLFGSPIGMKATTETISISLSKSINDDEIRRAISYLEKASIIVFRKFDQAYSLWEGSDVDLDKILFEADAHSRHGELSGRLKDVIELRPIISRAHYIKKGTLRYFDVNVVDGYEDNLVKGFDEPMGLADGRITFILLNGGDRHQCINKARQLSKQNPLEIYAFPKPIKGLEKSLIEFEKWKWVKNNTPELAGDAVARNEVNAQIQNAQRKLQDNAGNILGLRGYAFSPEASNWIQNGEDIEIDSPIKFQRWISTLCEDVFYQSPLLLNELINREHLSSSATSARRLLIEAMLDNEDKERLCIEGTPAEMSIYLSLLKDGGFHKKRQKGGIDELSFGLPNEEWRDVWFAIGEFLEATKKNRRPILDLYKILKAPPIGLREGPIPILLCAYLLYKKNKIALYEDGTFVPEIRIEVFELLIRVPESFEIQLYDITGETEKAFTVISNVLNKLHLTGDIEDIELLQVVRPLVIFAARLPDYTKKTKRLYPPIAMGIRDSLLRTRDPYSLLFEEFPSIIGVKLTNKGGIQNFSQALEESLLALQRAYPSLLDEIEMQIRDTFLLSGNSQEAKQMIIDRAKPMEGYAVDRKLALFIRETQRLNDRDWREVLARVIHGMPPEKWQDRDIIDFQLRISQLNNDFVRLEALVQEHNVTGASKIFRVGFLNGKSDELRTIISILPEDEKDLETLVEKITGVFDTMESNSKSLNRLRIAALAELALKYIDLEGDNS